ncbi:MAG TPA: hypothetical protein VE912_24060 [Bacteroidales bacterium]|nr:hypothetical protein [Bacteroidales bacterium]
MYKIISKISVKEKELIQNQYINNHFVLTEIGNKKLIFVPENRLFTLNTDNKTIKVINLSQQLEQIGKVKVMLGELKTESINDSENIAGYSTRGMKVININNNTVKFSMKLVYAKIPGIEKTVYPEFMKLEQSKQLVNLNIEGNEILTSINSEMYVQGNIVQKQSMEVVQIESDLDDNEEFDEYLEFINKVKCLDQNFREQDVQKF